MNYGRNIQKNMIRNLFDRFQFIGSCLCKFSVLNFYLSSFLIKINLSKCWKGKSRGQRSFTLCLTDMYLLQMMMSCVVLARNASRNAKIFMVNLTKCFIESY